MLDRLLTKFIRLFFTKEELAAIDRLKELRQHGVEIVNHNGGIEIQFRDDKARKWYYDQLIGKFKGEIMKLKAGMPLITKNPQQFTNAVVYRAVEGKHQDVVHVLTDYGNLRGFPSVEDVLEQYEVSDTYLGTANTILGLGLRQEWLDGQFNIRDRLQHQIELLTEALEGLE